MKPEEILLKNESLFQEHPFEEMYVKDKEAILKCMEDYHQSRLKEIMPTEKEIETAGGEYEKEYEASFNMPGAPIGGVWANEDFVAGARYFKSKIEKRISL